MSHVFFVHHVVDCHMGRLDFVKHIVIFSTGVRILWDNNRDRSKWGIGGGELCHTWFCMMSVFLACLVFTEYEIVCTDSPESLVRQAVVSNLNLICLLLTGCVSNFF